MGNQLLLWHPGKDAKGVAILFISKPHDCLTWRVWLIGALGSTAVFAQQFQAFQSNPAFGNPAKRRAFCNCSAETAGCVSAIMEPRLCLRVMRLETLTGTLVPGIVFLVLYF